LPAPAQRRRAGVTFKDGAATLGTGTLNGSGQATLSTSSLAVGNHSITAVYAGDGNYAASTSPVLTQAVGQNAASIVLASSVNPSATGQPVTFTAGVTGSGITPTGTVTFKDGAAVLGTGTLTAGTASMTTSALAAGAHPITAVYGGDANYSASTSSVLTQTVNVAADSVKLQALQIAVTKVAALVSGQAISGAIVSAIADGFADGCTDIRPVGSGVHVNKCPERGTKRIGKAFASLAQSRATWLAWADMRGTDWNTAASKGDVTGHQVNGLSGITYRFQHRCSRAFSAAMSSSATVRKCSMVRCMAMGQPAVLISPGKATTASASTRARRIPA
jgi:hypothetical protein